MPGIMRAAAIDEFGPADHLNVRELPLPQVGDGDVLVRVSVAGVQLTDAAIRAGWTPPGATITFPQVLGNEFSGTIVQVGREVEGLREGQEVSGFRLLGCYAEYVSAPADQVVVLPADVDLLTAGCLSASGQTAHTALDRLEARPGETLLVHGAAGGVGTMAVQLARRRGLRVIGTASVSNRDHLRRLGAIPVVYGEGELDRLREAAGPDGIDLALDAAGHGSLTIATGLVEDRGRIGSLVEPSLASELGCRWITSDRSSERLAELLTLCSRGELHVTVRAQYALDQVADAHRDVETGHGRGKVALRIQHRAT
ncbi:NADP-dependent oxidoreductase [Brachybacterium sacelli]|uniref:NADPH:quinone reductase-like Zn-dependent oxidoreductase n=1 Tax=Brachybacterium sacelli TaxID=173364 RepID=A0ABS4WZH7_9MICO|nr:NADP-dependent oxidoreductase [Brachybacterium sacelli]MBP2381383.1 NADPH:quinone reductase-like Zn-dependent oxidoreductase [Brachybacterium sacelli]